MKSDDIKKELEDLAPELNKLPLKLRESVPDGYFQRLPKDTWDKIRSQNSVVAKTRTLIPYRLIAGIAASLLVLFVSITLFNKQEAGTEELLVEDMVEYMMENIDEVDGELLFELYHSSEDVVGMDSEVFDYLEEEGLQDIDEQFLETLY